MQMRYQASTPPAVHLGEDVVLHPVAPVGCKTLFLPTRINGLTCIPSNDFPNHMPKSKMKWYPTTTTFHFIHDSPFLWRSQHFSWLATHSSPHPHIRLLLCLIVLQLALCTGFPLFLECYHLHLAPFLSTAGWVTKSSMSFREDSSYANLSSI